MLFKVAMIDEREVPNAYFSIIICGVLLTVLAIIGRAYARKSVSLPRFARWPVVGLEDLDFSSWSARIYQSFFLLVFVVVPLAAVIHFWDELTKYGAIFRKDIVVVGADRGDVPVLELQKGGLASPPLKLDSIWSIWGPMPEGRHLCLASWQGGNEGLRQLLSAKAEIARNTSVPTVVAHDPCKDSDSPRWQGGVTWVPVVSPLLLVFSTVFGLVAVGRLMWMVTR